MKTILVTVILAGMVPSLGVAQDTARSPRRVERLTAPRRDTVRVRGADSMHWSFNDSIRFSLNRDSIRWIASNARFDTARIHWRPDSVRWVPSLEAERTVTLAKSIQNGNGAFAQHLFPPELVMQHQSRLKLTAQQRDVIVQEINRLQATAVSVQWRVADESEKLSELLSRDPVAETAAIEQMDKMIGFETAVKRAQLSMLIRIRNVLTPEQRAILQNLPKQGK